MFSWLNRAFRKSRAEDGFTLIELLIVIVIIGILAAIAIPVFLNQQNAAHDATVKSDARNTVIGVASALVTKPDATGFVVLAPSDTTTSTVKLIGLPSVVVTVPSGAVAVRAVVTQSNWVTVRGTGADYVVHAQSTVDGFWYEFRSKTGKYTSSTDKPAVTPKVPSSKTPVPNSVENPAGTPVRVPGEPVTTTDGTGGTGGTGSGNGGPSSNVAAFVTSASNPIAPSGIPLRWSIAASDATGMKLVALTEPTQRYQIVSIMRSTDGGKNWVALASSPQVFHWMDIASSADGTHLAAAADAAFFVSLDSGATWTETGTFRGDVQPEPKTVSISADGQKIVCAEPNLSKVWVSNDAGTTWTSTAQMGGIYSLTSTSFTTAVMAPDGTKIVAGVSGIYGTGRLLMSTNNGATWDTSHVQGYESYAYTGTPNWDSLSSSSDGQKLVASIADQTAWLEQRVATSTDGGITWVSSPFLGSDRKWSTASSLNGNVLAVGSRNGYIYISIDGGATWKVQTSAGVGHWTSLALSADGTHLAAVNIAVDPAPSYLVTATL